MIGGSDAVRFALSTGFREILIDIGIPIHMRYIVLRINNKAVFNTRLPGIPFIDVD